jgi:primosomal protein N'
MRKVAVLFLAFAVALPALAQEKKKRPGGGAFGGFGGGGVALLLTNADVQKDIGMTDAQKEAVKAFGEKQREMFQGFQNMSQEERQEAIKKIATESEKLVKDLKPEQQTRLKQIQIQQGGIQIFANPDRAKAIGLTDDDLAKVKLSDEQKEKLTEINQKQQQEMRELFQGGFSEDTQKKMTALRKEYADKAIGVLTDDQKKAYKEMSGKPFEGNLFGGLGGGGAFGKKKKDKDK